MKSPGLLIVIAGLALGGSSAFAADCGIVVTLPSAPPLHAAVIVDGVAFAREGKAIAVWPGSSALHLAPAAGLTITFAGGGQCDVEMPKNTADGALVVGPVLGR